ncbi:MAG: GNAT family N-acetyltransferase [Gammaproteobacteria bacterium]|nr:GNAT family N-acetyltransferase [Gammaproteobacteria bacterium]
MRNAEPAQRPQRTVLDGRYCRLEPLDVKRHSEALFHASTPADAAGRFLYLGEPAPSSKQELTGWVARAAQSEDPLFFAVIDKRSGQVEGRQSFLRITPAQQCIEIGNIYWGPAIAGTQVATEANFLFAQYVFDALGYRRFEWKCNALNAPSRRAALRFGFKYEGHFRRAVIVRGRSRDTSWFSIIDEEWPALKTAYGQWLDPQNFDENGHQKTRLSELTVALNGT